MPTGKCTRFLSHDLRSLRIIQGAQYLETNFDTTISFSKRIVKISHSSGKWIEHVRLSSRMGRIKYAAEAFKPIELITLCGKSFDSLKKPHPSIP
jgi:hypothetical protein